MATGPSLSAAHPEAAEANLPDLYVDTGWIEKRSQQVLTFAFPIVLQIALGGFVGSSLVILWLFIGTGLGLSTSHAIVTKRHKGEIRVDSRPGRTRFTVWLPIEAT